MYKGCFYFVIDDYVREEYEKILSNITVNNPYILMSFKNFYEKNFIRGKIEYIYLNYKLLILFLQNRIAFLYKRSISNPNYMLCKKRLLKEFNQL